MSDATALIENAPDCIDEMMSDLEAYSGPLGPGPYWLENQKATIDWLKRNDLNQFRVYGRSDKALSNMGGGSRWRDFAELEKERIQLSNSLLYRTSQKIGLGLVCRYYSSQIRNLAREQSAQKSIINLISQLARDRDSANELAEVSINPTGFPSDLINIDGRFYTPKFLDEFLKYLDIKAQIDFSRVATLVEIGPGAGTFAELMAKLDTARRLYLIDIPPQLYVTQQVLSAAFPGQVADYQLIKNDPDVFSRTDFRIFVMAPWQAEKASLGPIDLAFNQVSFSEMHIETVEGYLSLLECWGTRTIAIRAADERKREDGPEGKDYARFLPDYELQVRVPIKHAASAKPASLESSKRNDRTASAFYFKRKGAK